MSILDFMTDGDTMPSVNEILSKKATPKKAAAKAEPETSSKIVNYKLTDLAGTEWRNFAIYTIESRAIPSMIDGLKPVQRFYLYSSIVNSPREFKKVESVGGQLPDFGYNHGTVSGQAAGQLMAATWANNIRFIEGEGSFGTRLVQKPAAPRYTKTRLHPDFHKFVKDIDIAPANPDPEHIPPSYYIPIVPMVLANGIRGIATGFATNIMPRRLDDLVAASREYLETGKITSELRLQFPQANGPVVYNAEERRYYCYGTFERKGKTVLTITEVPHGYDREDYVEVLNGLEEEDLIVGYDDLCDKEGFRFDVKLKLATSATWSDEEVIKRFKLCKTQVENITVIDENGRLREYEEVNDLIADFCEFRRSILAKRIEKRQVEASEEIRWLSVRNEFIEAVLSDTIQLKGQKRDALVKTITEKTEATVEDCDRLLRMNVGSFTKEMIDQAKKEIAESKKSLKFWQKTTVKEQYALDLDGLM